MRLSTKHGEMQQVITRADFTGGLNTASAVEGIAENQLAETVNLEIDVASGRLMTVAGTVDVLKAEITAAIYDSVNSLILLVLREGDVKLADLSGNVGNSVVGKLSGALYPKYCEWENGVLIASGGALQYFNGLELLTLETPPANEVFVRKGRAVISAESTLRYSGIGDETDWTEDNNRENASKFIEIGYKDGGKIIGAVSMAQDIFVLKDNGRAYRLSGEFPNWTLNEVATAIECGGRRSICATGEEIFVLGANEIQQISNAYYGNMKPEKVSMQIKSEVQKLPRNAQVRYLSPLWQVWFIGKGGLVLMYDLRIKSWWKRQFNGEVIDVFAAGEEIFVVKADRVSKLAAGTFKDAGEYLSWRFTGQRLVSHHESLLKRMKVAVTPLNCEYYCGQVSCGKVVIPLPIPERLLKVYANDSPVYRNKTKIDKAGRLRVRKLPQNPNEDIFKSEGTLPENRHKLFSKDTYVIESRNVYRRNYLDVEGHGTGGRFILNAIVLDVAEV